MAGNQCPSCNKMAGLEYGEPEVNDLSFDGAAVKGEVRLALTTSCCGDEIKEYNFELEDENSEIAEHLELGGKGHDIEVEEESTEADDYYAGTDKHGKPIKNIRYQKHMYRVTTNYSAKCSCGETWEGSMSGEAAGGEFEEL